MKDAIRAQASEMLFGTGNGGVQQLSRQTVIAMFGHDETRVNKLRT